MPKAGHFYFAITSENWAQTILERTYGYQKDEVGLNLHTGSDRVEKDKLKTTVFPVTLEYAVASAYDCNEENPKDHAVHAFVQIGDASRSANFHLAHGTDDAIQDGITVAQCIAQDNTFDVVALNKHHQDSQERVAERTKSSSSKEQIKYTKLETHYKQQSNDLIEDIKKNIFPYLEEKEERELIEEQLQQMQALSNAKRYGDALVLAEDIFDKIHEKLLDNIEHFSKPLPELQILQPVPEPQNLAPTLKEKEKEKNEKKLDSFMKKMSAWFRSFKKTSKQQVTIIENPIEQERILQKEALDKFRENSESLKEDISIEIEIKHKSQILHQFRDASEALSKLDTLKNLDPGKRLAIVKPDQTKLKLKKS